MLNCLRIIKDIFTFHTISWILLNRRRPISEWSHPICYLSYTDNTMPADALATLGARASAGMVVIDPQSWNIPSPASEELIVQEACKKSIEKRTCPLVAVAGVIIMGPSHYYQFGPSAIFTRLTCPITKGKVIMYCTAGIILCMCPANERRCYNVTLSLIGWAHSQNDPCSGMNPFRN